MKTGAWLRGGRGKIAGMVAQKSSDGKGTVLRELVTPSNPQTVDQMATRLAFGTVTQAAALMLPIIGQTFKGQGDEKMNRRRFVALNVPQLKAEAISQRNGGEVAGLFRAKSSSTLVPNSYIMSEGSLVTPATCICSHEEGNDILSPIMNKVQLVSGESYNPAELIANMAGIRVSQQITAVGLAVAKGEDLVYKANGSADFLRESYLYASRMVLNSNAASFVWSSNMTKEDFIIELRRGFNAEKTSSFFIANFFDDFAYENGLVGPEVSIMTPDLLPDSQNYKCVAGCIIISQLVDGQWDYNNARFDFIAPSGDVATTNDDWYGLNFDNALIDYLGSEAASKLYTRKGGIVNDI